MLFLVGRVAFGPYIDHYQSFFFGARGIDDQTPLWQYLVIHGVPLFFVGVFLARELYRSRTTYDIRLIGVLVALQLAFAGVLWQRPIVLMLQFGVSAGAVIVALRPQVNAAHTPARRHGRTCAVAGGIFPEFFAIDGDVGRMNTIFKFYLQAWNLLALAAAASLPYLWQHVRLRLDCLAGGSPARRTRPYLSGLRNSRSRRTAAGAGSRDAGRHRVHGSGRNHRSGPGDSRSNGTWKQSAGCKTT